MDTKVQKSFISSNFYEEKLPISEKTPGTGSLFESVALQSCFVVCAGAKVVTVCNDTIGIWDKKNR
jgi:hypothetical protein